MNKKESDFWSWLSGAKNKPALWFAFAIGLYEAWQFYRTPEFRLPYLLFAAWIAAFINKDRIDGILKPFLRRSLMHLPRFALGASVGMQLAHEYHLTPWIAATTAPVMASVLQVLDVEPPLADEPVKQVVISMPKGLLSNAQIFSLPDSHPVFVECQVTGSYSSDFEIGVYDRFTRRICSLVLLGDKFVNPVAIKDRSFFLVARRSTGLTEKLSIRAKFRRL